jgi:hypothetical protein
VSLASNPFDGDRQIDVIGREAGLVNAFRLAASGASGLRGKYHTTPIRRHSAEVNQVDPIPQPKLAHASEFMRG